MKRIFVFFLVVVMLCGTLSASALFSNLYCEPGDVDGDGAVNNRDLALLQQVLNGWDATVGGILDVNEDGQVNNRDVATLQQMLNGFSGIQTKSTKVASKYVSLGAPAAEYYPTNKLAQCAWDMAIHDGRLYVGCGDYYKNSGDTPILSCPLNDLGNWTVEAVIPDEQVGRFVDVNGVLTIPGFDPVGGPQYGSYYELLDGQWVQQEMLPYGLHNFDIVWFQGRMYAAVGADRGESPIAYTEDGVTYETLPLYKDGQQVSTANSNVIRSCNLYVLGNELYADFWYEDESLNRATFEMYHYNVAKDRFDYVADLKTSVHGGKYSPASLPLWEKEAVGDKMFLTTGYLYYTTDFVTYNPVTIPNDAVVYDMVNYNDVLYILTAYETGSKYTVTVYSTTAAKPTGLRTEATYSYALAPTSFAVDADNFFIGMGNWYGTGSAGNGTILQIER